MDFVIYSCVLGTICFVGTYISIMLFNHAAHNQVRNICTIYEHILYIFLMF